MYQNQLYIRDIGSGTDKLVFPHGDYVVYYNWTADSGTLVFDYACELDRINPDGTGKAPLFNQDCYDDAPVSNPVDGRLVFHNRGGIVIARPDGTQRAAVPNTGGAGWPEWSHDGQWISWSDGVNIWKIKPDGSGKTQLTFLTGTNRFNLSAPWAAGDASLVGVAEIAGVRGVYRIPANGSGNLQQIHLPDGLPPESVGNAGGPGGPAATRITGVRFDGSDLVILFNGQDGIRYQLERNSDLQPAGWTAVGPLVEGVAGTETVRDSNARGRSRSFYRIRSQLP
jgi:hypothetical protein